MTVEQDNPAVDPQGLHFYRAFEDRFRGARELILKRLAVYKPYLDQLAAVHSGIRALDLGCGRGEWLEFLRSQGIRGAGADLDAGMLDACRERHLDVVQKDIFEFLAEQADESADLVSGFHLAEHLPFAKIQLLLQEAHRVLRPAGLLILETPNPENMFVSTLSFYYDPTHERPIPPDFLSFLAGHTGFYRCKIERVNANEGLLRKDALSIEKVLKGVSPDYAVIAQKAGPANWIGSFDPIFAKPSAPDSSVMMNRFDERLEALSRDVERLKQIGGGYENSLSWRITAPLRRIVRMFRAMQHRVGHRREQMRSSLKAVGNRMAQIRKPVQHWLYQQARRVFARLPIRIRLWVRHLAETRLAPRKVPVQSTALSGRGKVILAELQSAMTHDRDRTG